LLSFIAQPMHCAACILKTEPKMSVVKLKPIPDQYGELSSYTDDTEALVERVCHWLVVVECGCITYLQASCTSLHPSAITSASATLC